MRLKKCIAIVLVLGLTLGSLPTAVGAQHVSLVSLILGQGGAQPQLDDVERFVYGQLQEGAILTRIGRLEQTLFGEVREGIFPQRVEHMVRYIAISTDQQPSLVMQLNAVEWAIYNATRSKPFLLDRITLIERDLYGEAFTDDPVNTRVDRLMRETWPSGKIHTEKVEIPKGQVIYIALVTGIDSSKAEEGDPVEYVVTRSVIIDNKIAIPAGARGFGTVKKVETSGIFGKQGKVTIDWGKVQLMDGLEVAVELAEEVAIDMQSSDWAAAASLLGLVILGPVGIAAGALVSGSDLRIPAGSEVALRTLNDFSARGLSLVPVINVP